MERSLSTGVWRRSGVVRAWVLRKAEAPTLWPPDANSQLIGKDPNTGIDRWQRKKHEAEDEMLR